MAESSTCAIGKISNKRKCFYPITEEEPTNKAKKPSFSITHLHPEIILQNKPFILRYIFEYLNNNELRICKQVSTIWREAAEEIESQRIIILTNKIPKSLLKKGILQPQLLTPYLELRNKENVQFITEFVENHIPNCETCGAIKTQSAVFSISIGREGPRITCQQEEINILDQHCSSSTLCNMLLTQIAVFPSIPGIKIHRFSLSSEEFHGHIKKGMKNLSEVINVPNEELKCVLWFVDGKIEQCFLEMITVCATAGMSNCSNNPPTYSGIAFFGKKINAVSFTLCDKTMSMQNIKSSSAKQEFQKLKKYKIDQNKCVAFVFGSLLCKCNMNHTISTFKEEFPNVPILFYCNTRFFGLNYMPNLGGLNIVRHLLLSDGYPWQIGALSLVWFN